MQQRCLMERMRVCCLTLMLIRQWNILQESLQLSQSSSPSPTGYTPSPSVAFDTSEISRDEIIQIIKNARSRSAASPLDGYKIIKRCPFLLPALSSLFSTWWESASVPHAWKQAVVRLIPKSSASACSSDPGNFRLIALTSCIGKLFTSILKNRWLSFTLKNRYMDTNFQKAFINGVPGCAEHQCKLASIIKEATGKHTALSVCWLDLANAYSSVPHALIKFSLQHYHSPPQFTNTVSSL